MKNLPTLLALVASIGIVFLAGIINADGIWRGTTWVTRGGVIESLSFKDNFDYLYAMLAPGSGIHALSPFQQCTPGDAGALRFTPDRGLEGCDGSTWVIFLKPPPGAFTNCSTLEESHACSVPYSCNCGKRGCSTCMGEGTQRRVTTVCSPPGGIQTTWPTAWGECALNP